MLECVNMSTMEFKVLLKCTDMSGATCPGLHTAGNASVTDL